MKSYTAIILCMFLQSFSLSASNDKKLLIELDKIIENQKVYNQQIEDKIQSANQKVFFYGR